MASNGLDFVKQACQNQLDNKTAAVVPAAGASKADAEDGPKKSVKKKKENLIDVEPVKGTRDFDPEEMRKRNWLFDKFRGIANSCSFQEYDAPVLESEELYKRKAGEEITDQMYNFVDKGGRAVALRPEMTPSLARLVIKAGRSLALPIKWFSIPQCWRYEATTKGRRREHYQWNMDIFGEPTVAAEAELLSAVVQLFRGVGLTANDAGIKVSSRKVLQTVLERVGVTGEKFAPVCVIVDKLDKLPVEEVTRQLNALDLDASVTTTITDTLSLKSLDDLERVVGADNAAVQELRALFAYANAYGFGDYLQFDASIVRGLAYYTGIVFEGFAKGTSMRAICGGGRYDKLLSMFGNPTDIPACGFGFGDCVIMDVLEEKGLLPQMKFEIDYMIIPFNSDLRPAALAITSRLRARGHTVDVIMSAKIKLGVAYERADKQNARKVVLIAPDEYARGIVKVKDMLLPADDPNKEREVKLDEL